MRFDLRAGHNRNPDVTQVICRGCFKPNDFQQAGVFDERLVLDQIVQSEAQVVLEIDFGFGSTLGFAPKGKPILPVLG